MVVQERGSYTISPAPIPGPSADQLLAAQQRRRLDALRSPRTQPTYDTRF